MKSFPFCLCLVCSILRMPLLFAEGTVLIVEDATIVTTAATLTVVDSEGKKTESKPPEGKYDRDQVFTKAGPGDTVSLGSEEGGADLVLSGEVTAWLAPGTVIEIPSVKKEGTANGKKKESEIPDDELAHSLRLLKGEMFITVDAKKLKAKKKNNSA